MGRRGWVGALMWARGGDSLEPAVAPTGHLNWRSGTIGDLPARSARATRLLCGPETTFYLWTLHAEPSLARPSPRPDLVRDMLPPRVLVP